MTESKKLSFKYLGIGDKKEIDRLVALQLSEKDPPEERGNEPFYHVVDNDGHQRVKEKEKRYKKWMDRAEAEIRAELEDADLIYRYGETEFEKGKVKAVDDNYKNRFMVAKLKSLSSDSVGVFEFVKKQDK